MNIIKRKKENILQDKVQYKIDSMMREFSFDQEFLTHKMTDMVETTLFDYQKLHVMNIISALRKNHAALDGSNTGTGKTYCAIAACKELGLFPFIICPKSVISVWKEICKKFEVEPIGVINYETVKNGFDPIVTVKDDGFEWKINKRNVIIIFDEVHRCKNQKSDNGKLLLDLKNCKDKYKLLLLSATLCDVIKDFVSFGYMLNIYKRIEFGKNWIDDIIKEDNKKLTNRYKNTLHEKLFPNYGSHMSLAEIGEKFPRNQISAECYTLNEDDEDIIKNNYEEMRTIMDKSKESREKIKEINEKLENLENIKENKSILNKLTKQKEELEKDTNIGKLIKIRQLIELAKTSVLIELADKYLEQNKSVVIFVNFKESLKVLETYYNDKKFKYSKIIGTQTESERTEEIEKFQTNDTLLMLSTIQSGGTGVSLHDITGKYPRVSIISPSYSSLQFMQTLGRIYRTGTKTPVLQRIIFCWNTPEENMCNIIREKLKLLSKLTDDDLNCF